MGGNTQATVTYGNGEPAGDKLKVTFNGTQIGSEITVNNTGGWGINQNSTVSFGAQSGSGTLCVRAGSVSSNWVAKVDKIAFQ
jgi:hypothetical protein